MQRTTIGGDLSKIEAILRADGSVKPRASTEIQGRAVPSKTRWRSPGRPTGSSSTMCSSHARQRRTERDQFSNGRLSLAQGQRQTRKLLRDRHGDHVGSIAKIVATVIDLRRRQRLAMIHIAPSRKATNIAQRSAQDCVAVPWLSAVARVGKCGPARRGKSATRRSAITPGSRRADGRSGSAAINEVNLRAAASPGNRVSAAASCQGSTSNRQRRQHAEQHSVFIFTDRCEQKLVELGFYARN